ncbi:hypothetical protein [Fischerella sp. PCC 9605]|uniref:hypothetical protein n=1 Tax=Fischerella sp. PCC 9605 TaxID=1173024 RepID=UPI00047D592A|nr:hypothetical protein [Fischerella sp. PCC 9605]
METKTAKRLNGKALLLEADSTVTGTYSRSLLAPAIAKAVDHSKLITSQMVKTGAVVIDVGMNGKRNYEL